MAIAMIAGDLFTSQFLRTRDHVLASVTGVTSNLPTDFEGTGNVIFDVVYYPDSTSTNNASIKMTDTVSGNSWIIFGAFSSTAFVPVSGTTWVATGGGSSSGLVKSDFYEGFDVVLTVGIDSSNDIIIESSGIVSDSLIAKAFVDYPNKSILFVLNDNVTITQLDVADLEGVYKIGFISISNSAKSLNCGLPQLQGPFLAGSTTQSIVLKNIRLDLSTLMGPPGQDDCVVSAGSVIIDECGISITPNPNFNFVRGPSSHVLIKDTGILAGGLNFESIGKVELYNISLGSSVSVGLGPGISTFIFDNTGNASIFNYFVFNTDTPVRLFLKGLHFSRFQGDNQIHNLSGVIEDCKWTTLCNLSDTFPSTQYTSNKLIIRNNQSLNSNALIIADSSNIIFTNNYVADIEGNITALNKDYTYATVDNNILVKTTNS